MQGITGNVLALQQWGKGIGAPDMTEAYRAIEAVGARVQAGDLRDVEQLLAAQVVTLNTAFVSMMRRAEAAQRLEPFETYLRLGLRMQNQCRATAETLATMKMPPVFAKNYQANIANGPQQVNNGGLARAEIGAPAPNKLLEGVVEAERVDTGAAGTAAGCDPQLATLDEINRTKD